MKAFLLAAGLGTRLRPLTDSIPKCLVPINGRPLLAWWLDLLEEHGVTDVLINLHHLPVQVREFVDRYEGAVHVHTVMEEELLGSAGTLHAHRDFVAGEDRFLILYADNLTDVDLSALISFNSEHPAPLTVGLFRAENPSACGIAQLDTQGTIVEFVEKPEHPKGNLASAGMFVAGQDLFEYIVPESRLPYDFGGSVMPKLVGRMNGTLLTGYLRDIGTHESLSAAQKEWQQVEAGSGR